MRSQVGLPLQDTARRPSRTRTAFQPHGVPAAGGPAYVSDAVCPATRDRGPTSEDGSVEALVAPLERAEDHTHTGAAAPAVTRAAPTRALRSSVPQARDAQQRDVARPATRGRTPGGAEQQEGKQWGERTLAVALIVLSVLVSAVWVQPAACSGRISDGRWQVPQALQQMHAFLTRSKCAAPALPARRDGVLAHARGRWRSAVGRVRRGFARK